jgi:hypothetical protein
MPGVLPHQKHVYLRHIHAPTTTLSPRGVAASGAHTETIAQHPSLFFQQPLLAASAGRRTMKYQQTHRAAAPQIQEVPPGHPQTRTSAHRRCEPVPPPHRRTAAAFAAPKKHAKRDQKRRRGVVDGKCIRASRFRRARPKMRQHPPQRCRGTSYQAK